MRCIIVSCLPVYLLLSTLDFLEEGDAFLLVDGGGLYPWGLYLADLGGPLLILVAILVGFTGFLGTDNSRVASDVSIVCGAFLIELVPSLGNEPVE